VRERGGREGGRDEFGGGGIGASSSSLATTTTTATATAAAAAAAAGVNRETNRSDTRNGGFYEPRK